MEFKSTRDAYGEALLRLGEENPKIVALDADVSKATRTCLFAKYFPDRFFNVGVAEQNLMDIAAGLSLTGWIPVASTFAIFATGRAFDQIRNTIAYSKCNVKIVATHAGITVGEDGFTHQSIEDVALMRILPQMRVVVPADALETEKALRAAVDTEGPFYIRLGRSPVPIITNKSSTFEIGKANLFRSGSDLTIIANGLMVYEALVAAAKLSEESIDVTVINLHTVKPLDEEVILKWAKKTSAIVSAEEHSIIGGMGGAIAELLSCKYPTPLGLVGIRDMFTESGSPNELKAKYGLTATNIIQVAKNILVRKNSYLNKKVNHGVYK
ncbi:MAG: transketolase family protein [Actinobacteria bacterium]|nr:transketolase family protein [Actinomycetota bacterium]